MVASSVTDRPRVLVIDDDEVILATTQAYLQAMGYDAFVHVGPFGVSTAISDDRPDLVLLDVNMPGLSGTGLVKVIRKWSDGIRIYFYSSSSDEELEAMVKDTGADGYIRKGDRAAMREGLERALRR